MDEPTGAGEAIGAAVESTPDVFKQNIGGLMRLAGERSKQEFARERAMTPEQRAQREQLVESGTTNMGFVAETPNVPGEGEKNWLSEEGKAIADEARKAIQENMPNLEPGTAPYYLYHGTTSVGQMAPAVIGTILTQNPAVGAALFAPVIAGTEYDEARREGRTVDQATMDSTVKTAVESLSELLPLGMLTKRGGRYLWRVGKSGLAEGIQEVVNEGFNVLYDRGVIGKDTPPEEVKRRLIDALVIGAGVGTTFGIPAHMMTGREPEKKPDAVQPDGTDPFGVLDEDETTEQPGEEAQPDEDAVDGMDLLTGEDAFAEMRRDTGAEPRVESDGQTITHKGRAYRIGDILPNGRRLVGINADGTVEVVENDTPRSAEEAMQAILNANPGAKPDHPEVQKLYRQTLQRFGIPEAEQGLTPEERERVIARLERDLGEQSTSPVQAETEARAEQNREITDLANQIKAQEQAEATAERGVQGDTAIVHTPDNQPVEVQYEAMEADQLVASHTPDGRANPAFPADRQPRQRDRAASQAQIQSIAGNLNPSLLEQSPTTDTGAPIIDQNNIVESGNGRVAAVQMAARRGDTAGLKQYIVENADRFGVDPEQVRQMNNPVLVRRRLTQMGEAEQQEFARSSNRATTARLAPAEQAEVDAQRLSDDDLALLAPDESGSVLASSYRQFVNRFLDSVGPTEAAALVGPRGEPNREAVSRIQAALFQKAYGDRHLVQMAVEEADPDVRNILTALQQAAPVFARARSVNDAEAGRITDPLVRGIELFRQAKQARQNVDEYLSQQGLFENVPTEAASIASFIGANTRSARRMGRAFTRMGEILESELIRSQNVNLFEDVDITSQEIIDNAIQTATQGQPQTGLFEGQARPQSARDGRPRSESGRDDQGAETPSDQTVQEVGDEYGDTRPVQTPQRQSPGREVREPAGDETRQNPLFNAKGLPATEAREQLAANFRVRYEQVPVATLQVGTDTITSAEDLAHVVAPIRKHAQETFLAVVTDNSGKILNVIRHTKGSRASTDVDVSVVAPAIVATENAAGVWLAHQHPSGDPGPSQPDRSITNQVRKTLDGTGVELKGHVVLGRGNDAWVFDAGRDEPIRVTPMVRKKTVPITERVIRKQPRAQQPAVTSPDAAHAIAGDLAVRNAVILLDNRHQVAGHVVLSTEEMKRLREGSRVRRMMEAIDATNPSAAVIVSEDQGAARNMARFLNNLDNNQGNIRVLDALVQQNGKLTSSAEAGLNIEGETGAFMAETSPGDGLNVEDVTAILEQRLGKKAYQQFAESGRIHVVQSRRDVPHLRRAREAGTVAGLYDPTTGETYLVADNLNSDTAFPTFLHEVGAHYGLPRMIGKGRYNYVKKRLQKLAEAGDERVIRARARVPKNTPRNHVWDEVLAYLVQDHARTLEELVGTKETITDPLVRALHQVVSRLRAFLHEAGVVHAKDLRTDDIIALVRGAAGHAVRTSEKSPVQGSVKASRSGLASERRVSKEKLRKMGMDFEDLPGDDVGSTTRPVTPQDTEPEGVDTEKAREQLKEKGLNHPDAPEGMFSIDEDYTPAQRQAVEKGGFGKRGQPSFKERFNASKYRAGTKIRQGVFDQFAALNNILGDQRAWMMAQLSQSTTGALEAAVEYGQPFLKQDAIGVNIEKKGLKQVLEPLGIDLDRWLQWMVGNRAAQLRKEDRERLFEDVDIEALQSLNQDKMADGRSREEVFEAVRQEYEQLNDAINRIAVKTGLISEAERQDWAQKGFYVPFYRMVEDDARGPKVFRNKLAKQTAYKTLKGADIALDDPLGNILLNWNHLLSASMKNQAARKALDSAVKMGIAQQVEQSEASKDAIWIRNGGKARYYEMDGSQDSLLVADALLSMNYEGLRSFSMEIMRKFKRALTIGVTVDPAFRIANLLRDTIHSAAVVPVSTNIVKNVSQGVRLTKKGSKVQAAMIAGGGAFGDSGYIHGTDPDLVRRTVAKGITRDTILDSRTHVRKMWDAWQDIGARAENVNRAAAFAQALREGRDLLEANFEARDLLDFQRSGGFTFVRALTQTVPFLNARAQGIDRMYRALKTPKQRKQFGVVVGAYVMASVGIYLMMKDDEDYQEAEEWEKDAYILFKIPGSDKMYRFPKPFEVGVIGTLAERLTEQVVDDEAHGQLFAERLWHALQETLSFNPIPQAALPLIEVIANKNFFTERPIESLSMKFKSPEERRRVWTSRTAIGASELMGKLAWDEVTLSPVQVEHLVNGYLGWLGATTLEGTDMLMDTVVPRSPQPARQIQDYPGIGRFVRDAESRSSKYVTRFYENLEEVSRVWGDIRQARDWGNLEKAKKKEAKHADMLDFRKWYNRTQRDLAEIRKDITAVHLDDNLTPEKKREIIARLNREKKALAREIVKESAEAFR